MLALMFLAAAVFFAACYRWYGRFLSREFGLDRARRTPAEHLYDGTDYCPTHPAVLMGHHFSSIAGAGPIVGPITAAYWFGWLPAYLWCLIGAAFFGGPHDMGSLAASVRHSGKSMGEVARVWIGERGRVMFLCFTIVMFFLIIAAFLELAAETMAADSAVAFSAATYMTVAAIFGAVSYRFNISLLKATLVMLPVIFGSCWLAHAVPALAAPFALTREAWLWILATYILLASLLPVWLLLQPRDYLASYFLYFAVAVGGIGMVFGSGFEVTLPAFKGFAWDGNQYIWPILFVTVGCGAVSGFHSMVGSGTSSKQLRNEKDSLSVGYGGMLLEGLVAVIALGAVMIGVRDEVLRDNPVAVYAKGFGLFSEFVGLDPRIGASLGALAITSFVLTTLDTAARLTRYQIQELTGGRVGKFAATGIAVAGAFAFLLVESDGRPTFNLLWPVFGAANQLVAVLALLIIAVWLRKGMGKRAGFLMLPMWFLLFTTVAALVMLIRDQLFGGHVAPDYVIVAACVLLMVLAAFMLREAWKAMRPVRG